LKSDEFLEQAIWIIYEYQTSDEKMHYITRRINSIGFNKLDAPDLSHYAILISKGMHLQGQALINARMRMIKYTKQLAASEKIQSFFSHSQVQGTILRETSLAVLIRVRQQEIWVPKSMIFSPYSCPNPEEQEFLLDQRIISQKLGTFISGRLQKETDRALLLQFTNNQVVWVPKSIIYSSYDSKEKLNQPFLLANWFIQNNGLQNYIIKRT